MIFATGSSSVSTATVPPPADNNPPSDSESSASFSDVMQQQEGASNFSSADQDASSSGNAASGGDPNTPLSGAITAASTANPAAPGTHPAKTTAATVAPGSDLSAMIIQASVLAANLQGQQLLATPTPPVPATTPDKAPSPSDTPGVDLSALISQAFALLSGTPMTAPANTSTAAASTTSSDAGTTTASAKDSATSTTTASTLATLLAQASIALSSSQAGAVTVAGKDSPTSTASAPAKGSAAAPSKEKKSTATATEGSFLQASTLTSSASATALSLLGTLSTATNIASGNQTLTNATGPKNSPIAALSGSMSSLAGTANVEKDGTMNATLNASALGLLSATGANSQALQAQPDLRIQLASNHDFTDALKQVMHVAQITQTSESRTPMRVEMEIQTPPGAIVNIYVSRTGDQFRAQLSTNDPTALAWVQNQVTSLRQSSDMGVEVKWLPPQMETGPSISTAGSQDANLSWNQGGGQSGYQKPEERQQQQPDETVDELETAGPNFFMKSLNSAGRRA